MEGGIAPARQRTIVAMKSIISLMLILMMLSSLAGCIIHTRGRARGRSASCPPAHHWDGYGCVHNGRGPKVRDHRR